MRIVFLGDVSHPNAQSWIRALRELAGCDIVTWSLPSGTGAIGRATRLMAWIRAAFGMRRMVMRLSPDLVIAYRTTSYGFLAALSGFRPLVVAAQGETDAWPPDSWTVGIKRWMARVCLRRADLIHAWGTHMAAEHLALGADSRRILTCPRGVDLDRFTPRSAAGPEESLRLVSTRSLFPEYGHAVILEAVAAVARRGIPISIDIAGEGPSMPDLQQQAADLGLERVARFHGRVTHDQLPALLRQCNVYVSTPITEGVSASLFEAMACGCYPIVTNLVANRHWIVSEANGMLVPVGDAVALQEALVKLWQNQRLFADAAAHNLELVHQKASLKRNIGRFVENYERLVSTYRRLTTVS